MEKRQLDSRAEISWLVRTFYTKVRKDDLIGPIFNHQIKDWEHHLERLTDFWETNLTFTQKYKGNPVQKHIAVDQTSQAEITQVHFGRWLQLWFETINDNFEGDKAEAAKNRARNMSTHLFLKMYGSRSTI